MPANGENQLELCLRSGFPAGNPEVGAIWLGSNTACFNSRAQLDMVFADVQGDRYSLRPDSTIAATGLNG